MKKDKKTGIHMHTKFKATAIFMASLLVSTSGQTKSLSSMSLEQKLDVLMEENNRLKDQLNELQGQFHAYTKKNDTALKALPVAAPSVGRSISNKLKLTLGGQVNRAAAYYSSGRRSEFKHLDNNASSTRLTFTASGPLKKDIKVGSVIEGELTTNNTKNSDIGSAPTTTTLSERKLEAYVTHAKLGEVWMGQGDTAAHRISDTDLSGTGAISEGAEFQSFAGGVKFVKGSTDEPQNGSQRDRDRTVANTYTEIFGSSRKNRLKYVTPNYKGFTAQASHAMRDYSDVALKYAGEINRVKVAAAVGYASSPFNSNASGVGQSSSKFGRKDYGGGASILLPTGISVGGSYAIRNYAIKHRNNGSAWSTKLGYQTDIIDSGKTHMAVAYGEGKALFESTLPANKPVTSSTFLEDNSEKIKNIGVYIVQAINAIGTEVYAGYQTHSLKRNAYDADGKALADYNFKRIHATMMGVRVKF